MRPAAAHRLNSLAQIGDGMQNRLFGADARQCGLDLFEELRIGSGNQDVRGGEQWNGEWGVGSGEWGVGSGEWGVTRASNWNRHGELRPLRV